MGDHGILFQDDMVRALLDGQKTVTRRTSDRWARVKVGDTLWVRECWSADSTSVTEGRGKVTHRATAKLPPLGGKWRPSIHMPRWASRLTLRVIDVRRERCAGNVYDRCWYRSMDGSLVYVGFTGGRPGWTRLPHPSSPLPHVDDDEARREGVDDRAAYLALWEAINGATYPEWVWRIAFEVVS